MTLPAAPILGEYEIARGNFRAAQTLLTPPPTGVPSSISRQAAADLQAMVDGLSAAIDCFRGAAASLGATGSCDAVGNRMAHASTLAGRAMSKLTPYSSVDAATVADWAS